MQDPLSPSLFAILTTLIEERSGIHYDARDLELFSSKLLTRMLESGFESPLDYYYFLRYDDGNRREFDALIETLVVNETYFFRELDPIHFLADDFLPKVVATGRRARVWCAACSTGEEPLTLAMLLAERNLLGSVDIIASDISPRVLARAREGSYSGRSLRALDDGTRARWFETDGDRVKVRPEIREAVSWRRLNLLDAEVVSALGRFDVVLCRNVLIYFSEATVATVTARLAGALYDDGLLLVGASESLMRFGTLLKCEERGGAFFYARTR
jgi:chemotaxis protein methyltransferase CheR